MFRFLYNIYVFTPKYNYKLKCYNTIIYIIYTRCDTVNVLKLQKAYFFLSLVLVTAF